MEQLKKLVIEGEYEKAAARVKELLDKGARPEEILKTALIPSMDKVGELYEEGEYFIPELLWSARAMQQSIDVLKPLLLESGVEPAGTIVMGTVKGDRHDIGKNLVGIIFEGAGFQVIDLGVDIPPDKFVEAIKENNAIAVGLSALLTNTMLEMDNVVKEIKAAGLRDQVKIIIGGAPVTEAYAEEIGADYYGDDPRSAKNFLLKVL
jgi:methylmalonyl-CoA mutase cobalamin-binding domain/chain